MLKRTALATALLFGASAEAQAGPLLVDSFDLNQDVGLIGIPNFIPSSSQEGPAANVLGGFRDMQVGGDANNFLATRGQAQGGELVFSNNVGTTGDVTLTWDGDDDPTVVDPTGLGGIDITMNGGSTLNRFVLDLVSVDLPGLSITVSIFDLDGNISVLDSVLSTAVSASQSLEFFFNDFAGSADFTNVGAISLALAGPAEIDATFSNFQIDPGPSVAVPLPGTLPLLLAGLVLAAWAFAAS